MIDKRDSPSFNVLIKGKPRFIIDTNNLSDDLEEDITLQLHSGYQTWACFDAVTRVVQLSHDFLKKKLKDLNEKDAQQLISYVNDVAKKATKKYTLIVNGEKANPFEFAKNFPNHFSHIERLSAEREYALLTYTRLKKREELSTLPKWMFRLTPDEILGLIGHLTSIGLLRIENHGGVISPAALANFLADNVFAISNSAAHTIVRDKNWETLNKRGASTYRSTHNFNAIQRDGEITFDATELNAIVAHFSKLME